MTEFKMPLEMDLFFQRIYFLKKTCKMIEAYTTNFELEKFCKQIYEELHELYKTEEEANAENNDDENEHGSYVTNRKRNRPE